MANKTKNIFNFPTLVLLIISLLEWAEINSSPTDEKSPDKKSLYEGVSFKRVYPNLSFDSTIFMTQAPEQANRWYVIEKSGKLYWFDATNNDTEEKNLIIDLPDAGIELSGCNECGLLGMTFDPNFANNSFIYLSYTLSLIHIWRCRRRG